MYQNIVFDLGGVVVEFAPKKYLLDLLCDEKAEAETEAIVFGSEEWKQLDLGLMTRQEANEIMLEKAREQGRAFEVQAVLDDWMRMLKPMHRTLELIRRLKKMGYKVYYLSNIAQDTLDYLGQQEFFSLFEGGIGSCHLHLAKPDPRLYKALMLHYNLDYDETIFIDDKKEHAQAAYALGITGIHYRGNASLLKALSSCGIPIREHLLW